MIDLHTHIAPHIDDGADSLEEAVMLLRTAAENGTDTVVLTPHLFRPPWRGRLSPQEYLESLEAFTREEAVKATGVALFSGAEIYCSEGIRDEIARGTLITLNHTPYVLVEFSPTEGFPFMERTLCRFLEHDYIPILAHAERYRCLQMRVNRAGELVDEGCILQVNADSVLFQGSPETVKLADELLHERLVSVVASDAHDLYRRVPDLSQAHMELCLRYSAAYAELLLCQNPQRILQNETVLQEEQL